MRTVAAVAMRVAETIEIARPPEEVWAFVADHANDPRWCKKVKAVESVAPRRWQVAHKPVPLRPAVTLMVEQLELAPPRRLKLREEDDTSVFEMPTSAGGVRNARTATSR